MLCATSSALFRKSLPCFLERCEKTSILSADTRTLQSPKLYMIVGLKAGRLTLSLECPVKTSASERSSWYVIAQPPRHMSSRPSRLLHTAVDVVVLAGLPGARVAQAARSACPRRGHFGSGPKDRGVVSEGTGGEVPRDHHPLHRSPS